MAFDQSISVFVFLVLLAPTLSVLLELTPNTGRKCFIAELSPDKVAKIIIRPCKSNSVFWGWRDRSATLGLTLRLWMINNKLGKPYTIITTFVHKLEATNPMPSNTRASSMIFWGIISSVLSLFKYILLFCWWSCLWDKS